MGPILFSLFINDFNSVPNFSNFLLFADDAKLFHTIKISNDCLNFQADINNLSHYCNENFLTLNSDKCFIITYSRKKDPIKFNYVINGIEIKRVNHIKDLGVILDDKLTFNLHIDHIVSRSFKQLGFILHICKPFKTAVSYKALYYAFVRSILEFSSVVWSPFYQLHINRIERIQRKFLRPRM